jgi:hypothetical protein
MDMDMCLPFEHVRLPARPAPADLGDAKPYRNYVAVTGVDPFAHHFAVRYLNVETTLVYVRARVGDGGRTILEYEGGYGGGLAIADRPPTAPPPEVVPFARAIERQFKGHCHDLREFEISYRGAYRAVHVNEFIVHYLRSGANPNDRSAPDGRFAELELRVDAALTHVLGFGDSIGYPGGGFGSIRVPGAAHWVELDEATTGERKLVSITGSIAERVLAVARAVDAGEPATALADVHVIAPAALLPPGYRAGVVLTVSLHGRRDHDVIARDVHLPLDVHDAVFARATAEAEATVGSVHYKVHATLTPEKPYQPSRTREELPYRGTLHVRAEDDLGHAFERDYLIAHGDIDVEGEHVVSPAGFDLPGASSPSREHDLLHHTFAPVAELRSVDLDVDFSLPNSDL